MKKIYNKIKCKYPLLAIAITLLLIVVVSYGTVKLFSVATKNDLLAVNSNYNRIADPNTMDDYINVLNLKENSRNAGRVWSDKTVFAAGSTLQLDFATDGLNTTVKTDTDFLHVFSTIGSSQVVNEVATKPLDVVLLLDISSSMTNSLNTDQPVGSRDMDPNDSLHKVIKEANLLISQLMGDSEITVHKDNRVGVVVYGGGTQEALPLKHYESLNSNNTYIQVGTTKVDRAGDGGGYFPTIETVAKADGFTNKTTQTMIADSTYLQGALYQGMKMLSDSTITNKENRTPVLIVLTDGATNIVSATKTSLDGNTSYNWWEPFNGIIKTDGGAQYTSAGINPLYVSCNNNTDNADKDDQNKKQEVQAISTRNVSNLLLAGYYQKIIKDHYNNDMIGFSIGYNVGGVGNYSTEQLLGTLYPSAYFDENKRDFTNKKYAKDEIDATRKALEEYFKGTDASMRFPREGTYKWLSKDYSADFTFKHPKDEEHDLTELADVYYIDKYYTAESDNISDIFGEILEQITGTTFSPVGGENASGVSDSLTYMDPIGEYMEIKDKSITLEDGQKYDLGLSFFGKMHGLVKTAIYDFQWNDTYMKNRNNGTGGQLFAAGWYKGTPEATNTSSGNDSVESETVKALPEGCDNAAQAWEKGWVYRIPWSTAVQYVPTLKADTFDDITDTQKNTVYTIYRFDKNITDNIIEDTDYRNTKRLNPCYEKSSDVTYLLSDIRIWVEDTGNYQDTSDGSAIDLGFDEAIYVDIPVSALPIQKATITLDADGNVTKYETNLDDKTQSTPFRLFYGVGVQDKIMSDDGLDIDATKLSPEYIQKHSQKSSNGLDNEIFFLSNYYSNTPYKGYITGTRDSYTRGDPNFTFSPSTENRYYVFQKPLILYKYDGTPKDNYEEKALNEDEYKNFIVANKNKEVTNGTDIKKDSYYWIVGEYYTSDNKLVHLAVTRSGGEFGSEIAGTDVTYSDYLVWYNPSNGDTQTFTSNGERPGENYVVATKVGGLRIGNMLNGRRQKSNNTTSTAYNYYIPTVSEQSGKDNIIINGYLGNNGKLVIPNTTLEITKEVESIFGNDYSKEEFNYELYIAGRVGDFNAVKMIRSPFTDRWQLRIDSIDVITNNVGLLQLVETSENDEDEDVGHSHSLYEVTISGTKYYVYVGGDGTDGPSTIALDGIESEEDPYSFRLYDASDTNYETLKGVGRTNYVTNPDDYTDSDNIKSDNIKYAEATDDKPAGTIEFWIKDAYLIPTSKVDNQEWSFDKSDGYDKIKTPIVISTLDPYKHGKDQLTSTFATNSAFGTTKLYFGYGEDPKGSGISKPDDMTPADWAWLIDPKNKNKTKFTLKDGEGIFLAGLPESTQYRIYEMITPEQAANGYDFGYIYGANGREQKYNTQADDGVYSQGSSGYSGQRDLHIVNTYRAHYDLTLDKTVLGSNGDSDKEWNFNIKLTPPKDENGVDEELEKDYQYYGPCEEIDNACIANGTKTVSFTKNEDGTYTGKVSLKDNQKIKIINILSNTTYEITEDEANQDGYESFFKDGKDYSKDSEGKASGKGTFDSDQQVGMINANWKRYDLTLKKTVLGSGGSKTRDFTFKVTLTPKPNSNVHIAESYSYDGSKSGEMEFKDNEDGSYTGTIKLKDSESVTIKGIPENVDYKVVEVEANKNGYVTTIPDNAEGTLDDENQTNPTVEVHFINGKYELHDLTIEKVVRGADGDTTKDWKFKVTLEPGAGIIIKNKYDYEGSSFVKGVVAPEDGEIEFTDNGNGAYTAIVTLKHGQAITIKGIPENTKYTVEEVDVNTNEYTVSDSGNTEGTVNDQHVRFTNKKLALVSLSVSKEVKGESANLDLDWEFEITLIPGAADLNTSYEYEKSIVGVDTKEKGTITFTENNDGTYTGKVTLKHGQVVTIQGIPETTKYIVKELGANTEGYFTSSTNNKTGILGNTDTKVDFVNELLPNSSLTIAKEVLGSAGDPDKDWTFQIELTPVDTEFTTTYNYVGRTIIDGVDIPNDNTLEFIDDNGDGTYTATVTLIHGQAITILDLPTGTKFKVSEVEANTDGYRTSTNREVTGTIDGATVADIIVYSNIKTFNYDLRLGKQVVGTLGDKNKAWKFNIRLIPDEYGVISSFYYVGSKTGTLNFVRQDDGSYLASISLKHNEHITIKGIPENTRYSIEEEKANQDGYVTHVLGKATDFLTESGVVEFVNTKFNDFNLTVKKNVKGSLGDKTKDWNFRIEFVNPEYEELEQQYKYSKKTVDEAGNVVEETGFISLSSVGGSSNRYEAFITLKDGESFVILGLPEGTSYSVVEAEANQDGYETKITNNNIGILESNEVVEFINSKYLKYDLTIEKKVTGIGDKTKEWHFDITLTPMDGLLLNGTYNYVGSKTGTITFTRNADGTYTARITLRHGESITIQDLPEYTKYSVTEVEANQDGYETTSQNESGELNKDGIKVVYTNFKEEPPTGDVTPPPHTGVEATNSKVDYIVETLLLITYLIISIKVLKRI